ncbi:Serine--tRNA ligase [Raphanus sativus]|nr:Serine--tRNA ligase [Raphanus sativus]
MSLFYSVDPSQRANCITGPSENDSWAMLDEMIEELARFLPSAAKKYDLEGWFPASCPLPTVQSTKLEDLRSDTVRNKNNEQTKQYVHMLTSTLTATEFRHSQELPARLTFLPFKTKPFVTETKGKKS